jgi:hypothetical protein
MAREIGYFYYKSRTSIEMYGSGDFYSTKDEGYIYGWSETLTTFTLRAYLKTFVPDTTGSKAGIQLRQQAFDNVPFVGIMVDGDGFIKIYRRAATDGIVLTSFPTNVGVTQGIWFEMYINGNTIAFKYSLQPELTAPSAITWITLDTSVDDTAAYGTIEKHLCCSSGSDNVNLAYFTQVYTEDCWISPIGQKE